MNNGQDASGRGSGPQDATNGKAGKIPDLIATPPPSRDHLTQLVFPARPAEEAERV